MKGFKNAVRIIHLWLGLISGLVVFTVAITGCIYAFEEEFRSSIYSDLLEVKTENVSVKTIAEILPEIKKKYPKPGIKNIRIKNDPASSIEIILKNKLSVFVNPYNGKILGTYNKDTDFLGTILKIHRNLYLGDPGKIITGTSALIFVLMLISGMILWWPKKRQKLKRKFSLVKNAKGKFLTYDLHSILGFYASWIIIFTASTGIIWSFKWAEKSMYWVTNSVKEETKFHSDITKNDSIFSLDQIIAKAKKLAPQTQDCFINMPEDSAGIVKVSMQYEKSGFFRKTDQLIFDQYTGELIKSFYYKDSSAGDKMKATNYNIHTGKVFGLTGQLFVFFAALIAASLPVTGFMMWWRKRKKGKRSIETQINE